MGKVELKVFRMAKAQVGDTVCLGIFPNDGEEIKSSIFIVVQHLRGDWYVAWDTFSEEYRAGEIPDGKCLVLQSYNPANDAGQDEAAE